MIYLEITTFSRGAGGYHVFEEELWRPRPIDGRPFTEKLSLSKRSVSRSSPRQKPHRLGAGLELLRAAFRRLRNPIGI